MIKVVLLRNVSPINFGGIKKHCIELSELFKDDIDLYFLPIKDLSQKRFPIIRKTYFKFSELYNYINKTDCNIVHIHGFASLDIIQCFIVARLLNKKIVYSPHFHPFRYLEHPLLGKMFFYLGLRFLLRSASAIVTITNNDAVFFQKYHKRVYKIPHQYTPLNMVHCMNERKRENMILFVGRNDENKGISYLYNLDPKYEIHVVSKGTFKRKDFIVHCDISEEELSVLYSRASLVVIPSRYEAFSYVALEAFAHNTPVVMSDKVMIADYLKNCSGYSIFKYGDVEDFLQAVENTIGQVVDVDKILSQFREENVKRSYKQMYMNVIDE